MTKKGNGRSRDGRSGDDHSGDYEVGYGKPPRATRFRKGQSGNPRGRPKGSRSIRTILQQIANETIEIREGEKLRRVSRFEAVGRLLFLRALKGDHRATDLVFSLCKLGAFDADSTSDHVNQSTLAASARAQLNEQIERIRARLLKPETIDELNDAMPAKDNDP